MMKRLNLFCIVALCLVYLQSAESRQGFGAENQEWDYVEVRPGAHMFWWLYYTTNKTVSSHLEKPLVVWLEGGPGTSGTGYANFKKGLGPYDENLNPRNHSWVNNYNVLFIDSPVGAGFSYIDNGTSYSQNNTQVARDLLECMRGFYEKLPEFRKVPVYIMSVSYGGKMAAEFALLWYTTQKSGSIESDLRGVGLGDSWISPIDSVLSWAPYLLNLGLVDEEGHNYIAELANVTKLSVEQENWSNATIDVAYTFGQVFYQTSKVDENNILTRVEAGTPLDSSTLDGEFVLKALMNGQVKQALNLSHNWTLQNDDLYFALGDFMKPVTNIVEQLLDETPLRVFVYNGQLDMITPIPGTMKWINNLKSEHAKKWKKEPRIPVVVDGFIEGFKKNTTNFSYYWVQRAGHYVAADNPTAAAVILNELTLGYNNNLSN